MPQALEAKALPGRGLEGRVDGVSLALGSSRLLRELGVGATFFVCPGLFGNTEDSGYSPLHRVLTREEAGELAELGFDLGAHSMTHPDLVECDDAELRAQLQDSKAEVEAITGRPCTAFAYPFGLHDARVRAATQAAGFAVAYQYGPGPWSPSRRTSPRSSNRSPQRNLNSQSR